MEACLNILHAKCQVNISIFGKHIAQKPYPLMTYFVETAILRIFMHRTEMKMTFLNSEINLAQKKNISDLKKQTLTFCYLGSTRSHSVLDFHGIRLQNDLDL